WNSEEWDNDYHPVTGETIISHPRTIETYPAPEKKAKSLIGYGTLPKPIHHFTQSCMKSIKPMRPDPSYSRQLG
ncbi:MAG: hypothetical protein ACRESL_10165, partial [Pseudomonas sp.]